MKIVSMIGFAAAIITTSGFLPQVIKGFVTKKVEDVAIWQPVMLSFGMLLWLAYGIMLKEIPIIAANAVAFAFNVIIIAQKFMYAEKGRDGKSI